MKKFTRRSFVGAIVLALVFGVFAGTSHAGGSVVIKEPKGEWGLSAVVASCYAEHPSYSPVGSIIPDPYCCALALSPAKQTSCQQGKIAALDSVHAYLSQEINGTIIDKLLGAIGTSQSQDTEETGIQNMCNNAVTTVTLFDDLDCRMARVGLDHSKFYDYVGLVEVCKTPSGPVPSQNSNLN